MKSKLGLKLGIAVAGVLFSGMAIAQAPGGGSGPVPGSGPGFGDHRPPFERAMGGDHGRWWNNPKTVDRLKLTDTQRKAMDDTLQQHRSTLIDLRASLEKSELDLEPMMKEDQPNESQILAQIDKVAQARAELEKANARFLLQIRSKLTPEQWKQMQADRAARPHGNWGGGGPGGPGANWQHRQQTPPPDGQAAPPPLPQSMTDNGSPDAPPTPAEGASAIQ